MDSRVPNKSFELYLRLPKNPPHSNSATLLVVSLVHISAISFTLRSMNEFSTIIRRLLGQGGFYRKIEKNSTMKSIKKNIVLLIDIYIFSFDLSKIFLLF